MHLPTLLLASLLCGLTIAEAPSPNWAQRLGRPHTPKADNKGPQPNKLSCKTVRQGLKKPMLKLCCDSPQGTAGNKCYGCKFLPLPVSRVIASTASVSCSASSIEIIEFDSQECKSQAREASFSFWLFLLLYLVSFFHLLIRTHACTVRFYAPL